MTDITHKDKNTIASLYALIGAGAIMMVIPYIMLPLAGFSCTLVGVITAYIYRFKNRGDDIMQFHMRYLIRTFWWSSLILTVGIILFGCVVFFNGDMSAINNLMASAERGIIPTESDVAAMQIRFIKANQFLILISAAVCLLPYPIYLFYRIFKGVRVLNRTKKEG